VIFVVYKRAVGLLVEPAGRQPPSRGISAA
jgi:hypothetical protein